MVEKTQVARSKRIQRRTGKTFHVATRLLPERIRHPTYVLYGFFRIADEVVDAEDTAPPEEQRAELDRLRSAALGEAETDDPVLDAFASVRAEHGIADEDVHGFVDAMESDIDTDRYETYADLEAYMDGSASAVGRMMTAIMGLDAETEATALPHATKLGEAFQMTNFLRDVREDVVERDRVYLPLETLRRHGVTGSTRRASPGSSTSPTTASWPCCWRRCCTPTTTGSSGTGGTTRSRRRPNCPLPERYRCSSGLAGSGSGSRTLRRCFTR